MPITVSIVEDNDQLRNTLARVINRAEGLSLRQQLWQRGRCVEGAANDAPEVVLMDINLPGMNGVECVRKLKQIAPKIQIVMLTGLRGHRKYFQRACRRRIRLSAQTHFDTGIARIDP
jgi:DNA-binding NarL/FixJ family response regulator